MAFDGTGQVTIEVGAGENGFQFSPAGITVPLGTTVIWEWTGEGGGHNVSSDPDCDFGNLGSERTDEAGFTYSYTFDERGVAMYVCTPHRAQGMYGAIAVI